MKKRTLNFKFNNQRLTCVWNDYPMGTDSEGEEYIEMTLYDAIGKDPWDGSGMSASDFRKALNELPHDRELHLHISSKGGDVHDGMTIMSMLNAWPAKVTCFIDGIAASTASWMILAADSIKAYKNSQIFIHDAMAWPVGGNSSDLRRIADELDVTSDQIAGMYAEKTGKGARTMRQMMKDTKLMTGEQAQELGLVDEIIDKPAVRNFIDGEIESMRQRITAVYNSVSAPKGGSRPTTNEEVIMNRQAIIAMLTEHGVKVQNEWTDEQLQAELKKLLKPINAALPTAPAPAPVVPSVTAPVVNSQDVIDLRNELVQLRQQNAEARKLRITNEVDALIKDDLLEGNLRDKTILRAINDDTYLAEIRERRPSRPGSHPLPSGPVTELVNESLSDVSNHLIALGPGFARNFLGANAERIEITPQICKEFSANAVRMTNVYQKHKKMLQAQFNTNTIDSDLQRIVLLQEMLEEYVIPLLPFQDFCSVFQNVPLEGTDKVGVPFYPLQSAGVTQSWNPATGYNTMANSTTNIREVAVGGSGVNSGSSAAANTAKDRKYIGLAFDSYTLRRQPFFNAQKLAQQNANRLAVDIFSDVVSRVVNAANFGSSAKAVNASAFTADDVSDLYSTATSFNWPLTGRQLTMDHTYNAALLKDPAFKQYLAYGSTDPIRKARISEAYGFEDIYVVPNLTGYSPANEFLVGWIAHMNALLIATAPIMPSPEVRNLLTRYDIVTDPKTGLSFEYRQMANATLDQAQYICECSYGAEVGVASALHRMTSQ